MQTAAVVKDLLCKSCVLVCTESWENSKDGCDLGSGVLLLLCVCVVAELLRR